MDIFLLKLLRKVLYLRLNFSLSLEFTFGRLQQGVLNFQDSYNKSYRYLIYRENRVSSEEI